MGIKKEKDSQANCNKDIHLILTFTRTISKNSSFYYPYANDNKYYYDELQDIDATFNVGRQGIIVGDSLIVKSASRDFEPVIFLLNHKNKNIISLANASLKITMGHSIVNIAELKFTVLDKLTYAIAVGTTKPNQLGDYILSVYEPIIFNE